MNSPLRDAIGLHALNALPTEERLLVEIAVGSDKELSDLYHRDRAVAATLASTFSEVVPAESPYLWDRIAVAAGVPNDVRNDPVSAHQTRTPIWVAAAAAMIVIVALTATVLFQSNRIGELRKSNLENVVAAALEQPGTEAVTLVTPARAGGPGPSVTAFLKSDGSSYLQAGDLPDLPSDRTYQLWAVVDDRVISAALMGSAPNIVPFHLDGPVTALAITEEISGGVAVSQAEPVVAWEGEA